MSDLEKKADPRFALPLPASVLLGGKNSLGPAEKWAVSFFQGWNRVF